MATQPQPEPACVHSLTCFRSIAIGAPLPPEPPRIMRSRICHNLVTIMLSSRLLSVRPSIQVRHACTYECVHRRARPPLNSLEAPHLLAWVMATSFESRWGANGACAQPPPALLLMMM